MLEFSAAESDASAGEQAGVSGHLKVPAVFRPRLIVATAIGGAGRAIAVERHTDAIGTRNELLPVPQLHKFRV